MPSRYYRRIFIKGYFYHIYNRGANKEKVFRDKQDYETFTAILAYYLKFPSGKPLSILNRIKRKENKDKNTLNKVPNLVEDFASSIKLCAYCLMPNHFHLLVKQSEDPPENGITNLMRRLIITYAMFIKRKYDRSGTLFEGKFKNVLVSSDIQLVQLSKYIHRNPIEIQGSEPLLNYSHSSYSHFVHPENYPIWLDPTQILNLFSRNKVGSDYRKFVEEKMSAELGEDIMID